MKKLPKDPFRSQDPVTVTNIQFEPFVLFHKSQVKSPFFKEDEKVSSSSISDTLEDASCSPQYATVTELEKRIKSVMDLIASLDLKYEQKPGKKRPGK